MVPVGWLFELDGEPVNMFPVTYCVQGPPGCAFHFGPAAGLLVQEEQSLLLHALKLPAGGALESHLVDMFGWDAVTQGGVSVVT